VAAGARKAGRTVVCVGLADYVEPHLADQVDVFCEVSVARPGSWIRKLRKHGVTRAIMVGRVTKSHLFTPRRILHYLPDWRAFRIYYWRLRGKDKLTDTLLSALADELASGNIHLENSIMYCREHLADEGVMTRHKPTSRTEEDIAFGWPLAKKLGELDIGQAIAVREREVIAVEAIEGTAEMVKRAGRHCKAGGWTLVKTAKPQQDLRFPASGRRLSTTWRKTAVHAWWSRPARRSSSTSPRPSSLPITWGFVSSADDGHRIPPHSRTGDTHYPTR